ncbi:MAG: ThuA domain-containing protein [Oscillospiraceae bacterium]|nr:ThuA domain-containing protein [Oscillospiraceae bacterium]
MINVLVWNEFRHEKSQPEVAKIYPKGIHSAIGEYLSSDEELNVTVSSLDDPEQGLSSEKLDNTDVLIWWGHMAHGEVSDEAVERVCSRVNAGMGLIALHSAHHSKVFKRLTGTSCNLKWRHGDRERVWTVIPSHPIAQGIPEHFELAEEEMYGEPFDIPTPDEVVFMGWFAGGEVFRSGITYRRGAGKIFYFQPGHEEYPIFRNENVLRIIRNAVHWAKPAGNASLIQCENPEPLERK